MKDISLLLVLVTVVLSLLTIMFMIFLIYRQIMISNSIQMEILSVINNWEIVE